MNLLFPFMPNREHRPVWRWKSTPIPLAMVVVVLVCGLIFGCRELTTSSQFSVQQEAGVLWLTRPDGQRFFSFGVNCANRGETNAPDGTLAYHAEAIYPSDAAWASSIADRLTDWGFTTIGGWSDWELLGRLPDTRFIHTPVLHVGSAAGAPWRDLWNPQWTAVMEEQARAHIKTSDARVMGRYSDNELV